MSYLAGDASSYVDGELSFLRYRPFQALCILNSTNAITIRNVNTSFSGDKHNSHVTNAVNQLWLIDKPWAKEIQNCEHSHESG